MKSAVVALTIAATASATTPPASAPWQGTYRISPIDGSKIALPTKEQLEFQDREIGALIHFNIATYIKDDGCNYDPKLVPKRNLFNPKLVDTDQWMDSIEAMGGKYATLVAKHNCGFTTWPTKVQFDLRDGSNMQYNYTIAQSPANEYETDLIKSFSKSAQHYKIGHGFYYSSVVNNYLNVQNSQVRNETLADGQVGITTETYDKVVLAQLGELWNDYGKLTEIWFDGGYSGSQKASIQKLLQETQSQAVIFNGCDTKGSCVSDKPIRWVGTEKGIAPEPNWSTGLSEDGGDPTSPYFAPAECDTTLQTQGRWFFGVNQPLRSFKEMVDVYHNTVGRNCILALDLAPGRDGLIPADHAARYKQLGDFVKSCYGDAIEHKKVDGQAPGAYAMKFDGPTPIDRIVLMEDQTQGQVIRSYNVYAKVIDSNNTRKAPWTLVSKGTSVGHKKIDIFKPVTVSAVMVNSTYVDTPHWRSVNVHLCDSLP